ncbi:hypothetical protein QH494_06465 [Sphingomonas sp. AR_OL41]|uniref:hypothetical protein n=1 Tax=Sphingomonas sp. AR_OL41 TaxID=3042729 RepID=UPI00247FAC07|nr:hypothetical protein [Sphingomonas sp. AR_OL41]MDH7971823.1 hypothetical protein [Sphingomonas sp. AR_OL41]
MTSGATGVAHADVLQNQVLAAARATRSDLYAFRRTLVVERTGAARQVFEEAFDPRRPAGQQWSLLSVDGRAPTAKEAEQSRKVKRGPVPFYGEIVKWFGAPATRNDGAPGYVTYRFAQLPPGALKIGSHDASADTQAEALVNTRGKVPIVEQVRLVSTKGFRMMLVASVQNISIGGRYHLLADGYPVPAESSSNLAGSLLGKAGTMRATVTYGAFQKVR